MAITTINKEEFDNILRSGEPSMIEFMAPWCVHCRRIAPALSKVDAEYSDKLVIKQVNIDEEPALAEENNIELVPTFMFFKDGEAKAHMIAPDSKAKIDAFINENL